MRLIYLLINKNNRTKFWVNWYGYKRIVMRKYLVIYEKSKDGYSAYVPDLPGCTTAGDSKKEVEENIIEAIKLHLEVMREEGLEIPESTSESEMVILA